ncbi:uncharacterized protein LOC141643928 [Silene latifolia]|uniref:uncharacterized protein LOC141643928 n=1 Tax=Silene latifolia TaxID=37657 RepID=UPI003D78B118
MSGKFPNLSWWLWSGKKKDGKLQNKSSLNSSAKSNERELDLLNYDVGGGKLGSSSKRVSRKRPSREAGNIDKEHDSVVVPSDGGGYSSDSESDSSDWSIGWSEPHAPGFLSEDEMDGGFGVLVRCYGRTCEEKPDSNKNSLGSISRVPDVYVTDNHQKHIERWLSSLQGGN